MSRRDAEFDSNRVLQKILSLPYMLVIFATKLMNKLKELIKANRLFFRVYVVIALTAIIIILLFSKADGFVFLNPYHNSLFNYISYFFTFLGDGIFCIGLGVLLLLMKRRVLSLLVISSYIVSGVIAQVLKYFVTEQRPGSFPELSQYKYFIQDVTLRGSQASFPSGHTASAFALASVLAFTMKDKKKSLFLLLIAIMIGYSRIYTGNHFLIDVLGGSLIGLLSGILCWLAAIKKTWLV